MTESAADQEVLVLARWFPPRTGGVERYLFEIYRRSAARIQLLVSGDGNVDLRKSPPEEGLAVRRLPYAQWCSADRKAALLPMALFAAGQLVRHRPDQVHCGHLLFVPVAALARAILRTRVVVHVYGSELVAPRLGAFRRWALRLADAVLVNSEFSAGRVSEAGVAREAIWRVWPGVDTEVFRPSGSPRGVVSPIRLVTVGRLNRNARHKGVEGLLGVVRALLDRDQDAALTVIGDGDDRERLEQVAADLGLDSTRARFIGAVADSRLVRELQEADLFLLGGAPEQDEQTVEGFGMVLVEAAACGTPAVCGDSGGVRSAVRAGESAVLVRPGSIDEMVSAIVSLTGDAERMEAMSLAARRHAETLSWGSRAELLDQVIRDVAGGSDV